MSFEVTTFYYFASEPWGPERIEALREGFLRLGRAERLKGLILLGPEGVNATCSRESAAGTLENLKDFVLREIGPVQFKDSIARETPFLKFKVQIRDEIVTMNAPGTVPPAPKNRHLSPADFHKAMSEPGAITLDTRNAFEVGVGRFEGAVDFGIKDFGEFPERIAASGLPKDKKFLIYCTGGIRCEKAILAMESAGYKNVYQLEGGILKYLEEFSTSAAESTAAPRLLSRWQGECFVFDRRIAVDHSLSPTEKWTLCPHCGTPAEKIATCVRCESPYKICDGCVSDGVDTCSKNCRHHHAVRPGQKGPQQLPKFI